MPPLTSYAAQRMIGQIKNTFVPNPNRVNADKNYDIDKTDYSQIIDDYASELDRLSGVLDTHLKAITGDPTAGVNNFAPVQEKLNTLHNVFNEVFDDPNQKNYIDTYFSDIFGYLVEFRKRVGKEKVNDAYYFHNRNAILASMERLDQNIAWLGLMVKNLPEERANDKSVLNEIVSQLKNIVIKNNPDDPEKDMMGIDQNSPFDACDAKILLPVNLMKTLVMEGSWGTQNGAQGHDELTQLENKLGEFKRKVESQVFEGGKERISRQDYIDIVNLCKNVAQNCPPFMGNTTKLNPAFETIASYMKDAAILFKNDPEIGNVAAGYNTALMDNFKREYEELATIAFSGNITEKGSQAKLAWDKMITLKKENPELEEVFQKDRLAMMLCNDNFRKHEQKIVENTLETIRDVGSDVRLSSSARVFPDGHKENFLRNYNMAAYAINDAYTIQMLSYGSILEQHYIPRNEAEEFQFGENFKNTQPYTRQSARDKVEFFVETLKEKGHPKYDPFDDVPKELLHGTPADEIRHVKNLAKYPNIDFGNLYRKLDESLQKNAAKMKLELDGTKLSKDADFRKKVASSFMAKKNKLGVDFSEVAPIAKQGSDEAVALKDAIDEYARNTKSGKQISVEDTVKLFDKSVNYLHLKSSLPKTDAGQKRMQAGCEVLFTSAKQLALGDNPALAQRAKNELKIEMLRNVEFRKRIVEDAKKIVEKSGLKENNPELGAGLNYAVEMLLFNKEVCADPKIVGKKGFIQTKLNDNKTLRGFTELVERGNEELPEKISEKINGGYDEVMKLGQAAPEKAPAEKKLGFSLGAVK